MNIYYGIDQQYKDVTDICISKLNINNNIVIPSGDFERAKIFGDHLLGQKKNIKIIFSDKELIYDEKYILRICLNNMMLHTINTEIINNEVNNKIQNIHNKLRIKYGTFNDELHEQKMAVRYLTGNEKVLEIGGNIGRNSLIIASILSSKNNNNFLVLECDDYIYSQLIENRDLNNFNFHIENAALSKRKIIQKGWNTYVSDIVYEGYKSVPTIKLEELYDKYKIDFDTLVLDCEGAFYYILIDFPEILNNIKLIIMENDYHIINDKLYIDEVLIKNGFYRDYYEKGGWGPCEDRFFEVWKKC